jgi:hypothetical protein
MLLRAGAADTWSRATASSFAAPLRLRLRHGNVEVQAVYPVVGGEGTTDRATRLTVTVNRHTAIDKRVDNAPTGLVLLTLERGQVATILDTFSGGAHCCFSSTVAAATPRGDGIVVTKDFGNPGYSLMKSADGSGYVFRTGDDRLAYAFSSFAGSTFPIVIWSFRGGSFTDVSREYPAALANDAAQHWNEYLNDAKGNTAPHSALVAYLADQYRLGAGPAAWKKFVAATDGDDQFHVQALVWLNRAGYVRGSVPQASPAAVSLHPNVGAEQTRSPLRFHGFICKGSCAGHERGYLWAEEHEIDDPHNCYSGPRLSNPENSSFSEGCEAYVDETTGAEPLDPTARYEN